MTPESERVGECKFGADVPRDVRNGVDIAFGIEVVLINGGGQDAVPHGEDAEDGLNRAGGADHVAGHRLCRTHGKMWQLGAKNLLKRTDLNFVSKRSRRRVGIHVLNIPSGEPCHLDGFPHGANGTLSAGVRSGDVVGIGAGTVADEFSINFCAPGLRVFVFFNHHNCGAFRHDETATIAIEGARCLRGLLVGTGQGAGRSKGGEMKGNDGVGCTDDHGVHMASLDDVVAFADGTGTAGARTDEAMIWPFQLMNNGNIAGAHIADGERNGERGDLPWAFFHEDRVLFGEHVQTPGGSSDAGSDAFPGIRFGENSRILNRHRGSGDGEMEEGVAVSGLTHWHPLLRGEVTNFAADAGTEPFSGELRDRAYAAFSGFDALPRFFNGVSKGAHHPEAGDDNPLEQS